MSVYKVQLTSPKTPDVCGLYRGKVVGIKTATTFDSPSAAQKALEAWFDQSPERATTWKGEVVKSATLNQELGGFVSVALPAAA